MACIVRLPVAVSGAGRGCRDDRHHAGPAPLDSSAGAVRSLADGRCRIDGGSAQDPSFTGVHDQAAVHC